MEANSKDEFMFPGEKEDGLTAQPTGLSPIGSADEVRIIADDDGIRTTQKPIEVMRWCLGWLPAAARIVLDPYMGSGTTGVACATMGLSFIGIEREPKYFDIACKRIEAAYAQPDMFVEAAKPPPEQLDLMEAAE